MESILNGEHVFHRDYQTLVEYNEENLWSSNSSLTEFKDLLYLNMTLRLPNPYCIPDY